MVNGFLMLISYNCFNVTNKGDSIKMVDYSHFTDSRRSTHFTFIELLIVIAIITILAGQRTSVWYPETLRLIEAIVPS